MLEFPVLKVKSKLIKQKLQQYDIMTQLSQSREFTQALKDLTEVLRTLSKQGEPPTKNE